MGLICRDKGYEQIGYVNFFVGEIIVNCYVEFVCVLGREKTGSSVEWTC